ncbi:MAG: Fe-S cluster assembly protein SufD [Myxococcota bacterium]|jgi:Fe-S cluster assembly protein SufD|nr:Fe-S cluster assembly protein SufD [Myxococcota bacterium]
MGTDTGNLEVLEREHEAFLSAQAASGQVSALDTQKQAFEEFKTIGFPTLKEENWRYTNLKSWAKEPLSFQAETALVPQNIQGLYEQVIGDLDAYRLVFAGGKIVEAWSDLACLPQGLRLTTRDGMDDGQWSQVIAAVNKTWRLEKHGMHALNTAFLDQIILVEVDPEVIVDKPLHILHLMDDGENRVLSPRMVLSQGARSSVTLLESYAGGDDVSYFTNSATDIFIEESAQLKHVKVQREGAGAKHFSSLNIEQATSSTYHLFSLALGSQILRNDVQCVLAGESAHCSLDGLSVLSGTEHVDHFTQIEHQKEQTTSREFYKGVVGGKATSSFSGKVYVHPEAQKTDAAQTNRNLLTSRQARANTKPQLEIYADDVKCAHGATVGQLDAHALFYLRSRGIAEAEAKRLLLMAFVAEVAERSLRGEIKDHVQAIVEKRLAQGFEVEGMLA